MYAPISPNGQYLFDLFLGVRLRRDDKQPVKQVDWNAMWTSVVGATNPARIRNKYSEERVIISMIKAKFSAYL